MNISSETANRLKFFGWM